LPDQTTRVATPAKPGGEARPARRRKPQYCARPADVPENSPLPRYGWLVQHALILSYAIVLKAIWSLKPQQLPGGRGHLLANASVTRITQATRPFVVNVLGMEAAGAMPRRTVAHAIEALERRHFIERWESTRARTSPTGTHWRILPYAEILARWAADPAIGTVGRAAFYVMGKGRRFLGPDEVTAWGLNHEKAAATPAAQAVAVEIPEDVPAPASSAAPPAIAAPAVSEPELESLAAAIGEVAGHGDATDARLVWGGVLQACGDGEPPPVEVVAGMVRDMGIRWRRVGKDRRPLEPGLMRDKIGSFVAEWRRKVHAEASKRAKRESHERDTRISALMWALGELAKPDEPLDAGGSTHDHWRERLSLADPDELAEAVEAVEAVRRRA
jgi:hypothetical protein